MLAGLILPAWPIWRIRRYCIAIPVSALLSCWLLVASSVFTLELIPGYDGIGAAMTILVSPVVGLVYALVLAAIRAATLSIGARLRPSRTPPFGQSNAIVGLVAWASLGVLSLVLPFVAPPHARRGDPLFLADYFFFCGPIVLLAIVMLLTYALRLHQLRRIAPLYAPDGPM